MTTIISKTVVFVGTRALLMDDLIGLSFMSPL